MSQDEFTPDSVEWIVNDLGELGVRVHGRCLFFYKGGSIEYSGFHDDEKTPMKVRRVGKREFGECLYPLNFKGINDRYYEEVVSPSLIDGAITGYEWEPMPIRPEDFT